MNSEMKPKIYKMHFFKTHSFVFSFNTFRRSLVRYRNALYCQKSAIIKSGIKLLPDSVHTKEPAGPTQGAHPVGPT